jgi:hypothetical protein
MRRRIDIAPEPLSEQRWAKIERGVFARLDVPEQRVAVPVRSPRVGAFLAWGMAFAALVFAARFVIHATFKGSAPIPTGPTQIFTGLSSTHVAFEGLSLDVSPESALILAADSASGVHLVLDRGAVACDVDPRPPGAPFIVLVGDVRVRVVGTRFTVTRLSDSARVHVDKGVVEVHAKGGSFRVAAGESWPSAEGTGADTEPKAAEVVGGPPAADVSRGGVAPEKDSVPVPNGPGGKRGATHAGVNGRSTPTNGSAKSDGASAAADKEVEPASRGRTSQEVYELAARLEVNDAARALGLYRSLENGNDSWAQNALFAHGRLEATRGNHAEARKVLSEYLLRFPRGANADDASVVLQRLH